ncbi:MAG TPA: hypothetical protein VI542_10270 [Candidatus Tectomicrobia bacterium]
MVRADTAADASPSFVSFLALTGRSSPRAAQDPTGFGVAAVTAGVPLNLVQKWLGHAWHGGFHAP